MWLQFNKNQQRKNLKCRKNNDICYSHYHIEFQETLETYEGCLKTPLQIE